jgi:hypothetical protein
MFCVHPEPSKNQTMEEMVPSPETVSAARAVDGDFSGTKILEPYGNSAHASGRSRGPTG